jgi:hypothetical protein
LANLAITVLVKIFLLFSHYLSTSQGLTLTRPVSLRDLV